MRQQILKDSAGQMMVQTPFGPNPIPFYNRTIYSTWVLATAATSFTPFQNSEASTLRNYQKNTNPFISNQGRVLAIAAELFGASYASVQFTAAAGKALADAIDQLVSQAQLIISQDSIPVHYSLLKDLIATAPNLGDTTGTNVTMNPANPSASIYNSQAQKIGVYFRPPLDVPLSTSLDFSIVLPSGVSVAAALNTFCLQFVLALEEIPTQSPQKART